MSGLGGKGWAVRLVNQREQSKEEKLKMVIRSLSFGKLCGQMVDVDVSQ